MNVQVLFSLYVLDLSKWHKVVGYKGQTMQRKQPFLFVCLCFKQVGIMYIRCGLRHLKAYLTLSRESMMKWLKGMYIVPKQSSIAYSSTAYSPILIIHNDQKWHHYVRFGTTTNTFMSMS